MTDPEILDSLRTLLASEFDDVLFFAEAPLEHVAPRNTPQASRALDLVRWAQQNPTYRTRLQAALARVRKTAPPDIGVSSRAADRAAAPPVESQRTFDPTQSARKVGGADGAPPADSSNTESRSATGTGASDLPRAHSAHADVNTAARGKVPGGPMSTNSLGATLAGTFGQLSIDSLLELLRTAKFTGKLEIAGHDVSVNWFFLDDGDLVGFRGTGDAATAVGSSILQLARRDTSLGDTSLRKAQACIDCLQRMLSLPPATFRFIEHERCQPEQQFARLSVQEALMEAARRLDEWAKLPGEFTDDKTVFAILPNAGGLETVLTLKEYLVLSLVDEVRPLARLLEETPLPKLETARTLYALACARAITVATPSSPPQTMPDAGSQTLYGGLVPPQLVTKHPLGKPVPGINVKLLDPDTDVIHPPPVAPVGTLKVIGKELTCEVRDRPIRIGRALTNDLVLPDLSVSRYHARVSLENGYFYVRDLGSLNGVWINGKQEFGHYLASSAHLVIGRYMLKFEISLEILPGAAFRSDVSP